MIRTKEEAFGHFNENSKFARFLAGQNHVSRHVSRFLGGGFFSNPSISMVDCCSKSLFANSQHSLIGLDNYFDLPNNKKSTSGGHCRKSFNSNSTSNEGRSVERRLKAKEAKAALNLAIDDLKRYEKLLGQERNGDGMFEETDGTTAAKMNLYVGHCLGKIVRLVHTITTNNGKSVNRIHQLRTETRRAEVALCLFADWFPVRRTEGIRKRLHAVRAKAGDVRDLDVMPPLLERLSKLLSKKTRHYILERAARIREEQMCRLKKHCGHLLDHSFERRARLLKDHSGWRQTTSEPGLDDHCSTAINESATAFFLKVELLRSDWQQLHKVRIVGRKLRYALDLINELVPSSSFEAASRTLSEIQDSLGAANDQLSVLQFLRDCVAKVSSNRIEVSLRQAIESLEATMNDQTKSLVDDVIIKAHRIETLLAEVVFEKSL